MWDGLLGLLGLCLIMAAASFMAGSLPLSLSLSQRQLRLLSTFGTGVLIGTALIVIIPEGVETLYAAASSNAQTDSKSNGKQTTIHQHHGPSPHALVGLALISGYMLMYLIDTLPLLASSASSTPHTILLSDLSSSPLSLSSSKQQQHSTTLGLTIHAVADGIALGATATSPTTRATIGLAVFVALTLHKGPAAFGLTAVLLKQGHSKRTARAHLSLFSIAAPAGAIATWALINLLGLGSSEDTSSGARWTGFLLVFSGGTFLYVANHALSSHIDKSSSKPSNAALLSPGIMPPSFGNLDAPPISPYAAHHSVVMANSPSSTETGLMVCGMLVPLVMQVGHAHGHS